MPLAERGAHDALRRVFDSRGLLTHARTLSPPALTDSPRRAGPRHHRPARSQPGHAPPTFAHLALAPRAPPADLDRSFPIAGGRGNRRRAASFNAPLSRIALSRDDTKEPSSLSDRAGAGRARRRGGGHRESHADRSIDPPARAVINGDRAPVAVGQSSGGLQGQSPTPRLGRITDGRGQQRQQRAGRPTAGPVPESARGGAGPGARGSCPPRPGPPPWRCAAAGRHSAGRRGHRDRAAPGREAPAPASRPARPIGNRRERQSVVCHCEPAHP